MRYTLFSRGRPIAHTELSFPTMLRRTRFGWLVPTAEGERLMPLLAAPSPAILAYLERREQAMQPPSALDALEPLGSALLADAAEAAQHREALELELRRADGSVVPTLEIGIQDVEQLMRLARLDPPELEALPEPDEEMMELELMEARLQAEMDHDVELAASWWEELDDDPGLGEAALDDPEPNPAERYQIHVALLEEEVEA